MTDGNDGKLHPVADDEFEWPEESIITIRAEHILVPDADPHLFGNEDGFNALDIHLVHPVRLTNQTDYPALTAITPQGLVVTHDRYGDRDPHGFHHHLIPWSNIRWLHQYIGT
jgi:hypothetical protein